MQFLYFIVAHLWKKKVPTIGEFLRSVLSPGDRIGADPKLVSADQWLEWRSELGMFFTTNLTRLRNLSPCLMTCASPFYVGTVRRLLQWTPVYSWMRFKQTWSMQFGRKPMDVPNRILAPFIFTTVPTRVTHAPTHKYSFRFSFTFTFENVFIT